MPRCLIGGYGVAVRRLDPWRAKAGVRGFRLTLGARRGDGQGGPNPLETLLAALGSRLLTALQVVAEASRLEIREGWAELTATREDRPPRIKEVRVILHLQSAVPRERLVDLAQRNSTVLSTLAMAVPVTVELGEV